MRSLFRTICKNNEVTIREFTNQISKIDIDEIRSSRKIFIPIAFKSAIEEKQQVSKYQADLKIEGVATYNMWLETLCANDRDLEKNALYEMLDIMFKTKFVYENINDFNNIDVYEGHLIGQLNNLANDIVEAYVMGDNIEKLRVANSSIRCYIENIYRYKYNLDYRKAIRKSIADDIDPFLSSMISKYNAGAHGNYTALNYSIFRMLEDLININAQLYIKRFQ